MIKSVAEWESFLSHHEIEVAGRLVDASNATLLGTLDGSVSVIYKPIAGERPLWDFPDGNLASREVAAYLISRNATFNIVPPTIMRDGPYGLGAVQLWIDIDESLDVVVFAQSKNEQLRAMALFDAIVNNTDRKYGHILVDEAGKVFGCDHGVALHEEDKLRTVLWQWANEPLSTDEILQLSSIKNDMNNWELNHYLTAREIAALSDRVTRLLEQGRFPLPNENWPAIPWPPF